VENIGFCTNPDGARIAYSVIGNGPPMVMPPGYFAVINPYKTVPEIRNFFDSFARYHTVVMYDMHGAGLSDRKRTYFSLESELSDLEAVVNYLKLDKVILNGSLIAGPVSIAYAAKFPDRVTQLILYGTYAHYGKYLSEEFKASIISLIRQRKNWIGERTIASLTNPRANVNELELFVGIQQENTTPEFHARWLEMFFTLDATQLCPLVKSPTLVIHRKGDRVIVFKAGLELASLIPNARFVPLEGETHYPFLGDAETVLRISLQFLGDPVDDKQTSSAAQLLTNKLCHDVFISFAYPDKDAAAKIYAYLKSNNISPFWCEDLAAGQDYPKLLGEAIRASKSFLLVVSDSSDNSDSVRKETTIAHNNKKPIIPVRIKDILPKNLEYLTANSLFFDALPQPLEQHLPRLTTDIKKIIGSKAEKKEKIKE